MQDLAAANSLPWLIGGDFNELLGTYEKEEGPVRPINQILAFRRAVSDCHLHDLGFVGTPFTWITIRSGGINEHLDRALANKRWKNLFNCARVISSRLIKVRPCPTSG
ncbi:hypothetical protein ACFX11_007796 [Malus domestica]